MGSGGGTALVTGAGSGIGRSVAARLAASGHDVVAVGRRPAPLADLAAAHLGPGSVTPLAADVTAPGVPAELRDAVLDRFGGLDALVHCAGLARFAPLATADLDDLDRMLAVNVRAPAALVQAFLPELTAAGGCVVVVTSIGGLLAMPGRSLYGASKAAVNSLVRSLAHELAPQVRVNAIVPGAVETPMYDDVGLEPSAVADLRASLLSTTPMGRFGRPDEVAGWVSTLLDPALSGWVTGALVTVDGGRSA